MFVLIFFLLKLVNSGHLYTWDPVLIYSIDGSLFQISIPIQLSNALLPNNYLRFSGPILHKTDQNEVYTQITFNNERIFTSAISTANTPFLNNYYFLISTSLPQNQWLNFTIFSSPYMVVAQGLLQYPLSIATVSSLNPNPHVYDNNPSAGILYVAALPKTGMSVQVSVDTTTYPSYTDPGQVYQLNIDVTPRVAISGGTRIIIHMSYDLDPLTYQQKSDFKFTGTCSYWLVSNGQQFTSFSCVVNQFYFVFETDEPVNENKKIRLSVIVQNPPYVAQRDIIVLTQNVQNGYQNTESGSYGGGLVSAAIDLTQTNPKLLWGIDILKNLGDSFIGLWAADNPSQVTGPYNSVRFEFTVRSAAPVVFPSTLKIKLSCTDAISGGTKHNFQPYNDGEPVYCTYRNPYLMCKNIGTLAPALVYYISVKVYYSSEVSIVDFGAIQITSADGTYTQYQSTTGIYQDVTQEKNLYDIGGWHGPTGSMSYTQVSSIPGTTIDLSYIQGQNATIGIVPNQTQPSSILFFMKSQSDVYCGPSSLPTDVCGTLNIGKKYLKMTIMMNSAILNSNPSVAPKKLDFIAKSVSGYSDSSLPCISSNYCNQNGQNTYNILPSDGISAQYGLATFECGKLNSLNSDVLKNCEFLQGKVGGVGSEGIIALTNIVWKSGFTHTSKYADETLLDFVITFWQADILSQGIKPQIWNRVSSHLLQGYTIDNFKPDGIKISLVNYYMGKNQGNNGWRIPTMLRVQAQSIHENSTNIEIFFDSSIFPSYFLDDLNYSCSIQCRVSQLKNPGPSENWQLQSSLEATLSLKNNFEAIFPVDLVYPNIPNTIHIVLSNSISYGQNYLQYAPIRVFRIYGAAIQGDTSQQIPKIGNQIKQTSDLIYPYLFNARGSVFDFHLDLNTISTQGISNLTFKAYASNYYLESNSLQSIGAGLTIVSIQNNIFKDSTNFQLQNQQGCLQPFLVKKQSSIPNQDPNEALPRYLLFCPFDQTINYPLNLTFQSQSQWYLNYNLATELAYGLSSADGALLVAQNDPGVISQLKYQCEPGNTSMVYPQTLGRQRIIFPIKLKGSWTVGVGYYREIKIQIVFDAPISGFELSGVTNLCSIRNNTHTLPLNCIFDWSSVNGQIVVHLTSKDPTTYYIFTPQQIELIIPTRTTYGYNYGVVSPYTVNVLLPSLLKSSTQKQYYGSDFDTPPIILESCRNINGISLGTEAQGRVFTLQNFSVSIPNVYSASKISWEFGVGSQREFVPADSTTIQMNLGFLNDPNDLDTSFICFIQDANNNSISQIWNSIQTFSGAIQIKLKYDLEQPNKYLFRLVCNGGIVPGNLKQSLGLYAAWIETAGSATIQEADAISYLSVQSKFLDQKNFNTLPLLNKQLNSAGHSAIYSIKLTNGPLEIQFTFRIYVKFHFGVPVYLNRLGQVSCLINDISSKCYITDDYMVVIYPQVVIDAFANFILTISPVQISSQSLWPLQPRIWVAIDDDDNISNGMMMANFILNDPQPSSDTVTPIEVTSINLSGQYIRSEQTFTINLNLPAGVVNAGTQLFIEFPTYFMESLELKTTNSQYNFNAVRVSMVRANDRTNTELVKDFKIVAGNQICLSLLYDSAGNLNQAYMIILANIPMPRTIIPPEAINNFNLIIHIVQSQVVKFISGIYYSDPIKLMSENKNGLYWNGSIYQYERNEKLNFLNIEKGELGITIFQGIFRSMVFLSPSIKFNESIISQFNFQFDNSSGLTTYPGNLTAVNGQMNSKFLITASITPGYYIYKLIKTSGGGSYVNALPYLNLLVQTYQCQLKTDKIVYYIPVNGISPPIVINIQECFPSSDIRISLNIITGLQHLIKNPQSLIFENWKDTYIQNQLYFKYHNFIFQLQSVNSINNDGDQIPLNFSVGGTNRAYYLPPPQIILQFYDPTLLQNNISVNFVIEPYPLYTSIVFTLSCTDLGTIFWVIGLGDEIEYVSFFEMRNQTLYSGQTRTLINPTDNQQKIYGFSFTDPQNPIQEEFYNLTVNTLHTFKSYCINQIGKLSNATVYVWQTWEQ